MSADWLQIKTDYITGNLSYRKLAAKYGVPFTTLRGVAKREQWVAERAQARDSAVTRSIKREVDKSVERYTRLLSIADVLLDKIEIELLSMDSKKTPFCSDKRDLKAISSALKDIKDIQGLKSDIDIEEQKARIKKLEADALTDNDSGEKVEVVIGDADEWAV